MAGGLAAVDWSQPWFASWREPGEAIARRVRAGEALHEALNAGPAAPVRFVPQEQLPAGDAYERFIFDTGQCPVRPGLHDFFNALVWMRFPRTKAALNRLQAQEIVRAGIAARRGPVRDAITVFDENGALLAAPPPLWQALQARDWRAAFVDLRPLWREAQFALFGHALLEKLAAPRKDLTAHVWAAPLPPHAADHADAWLAAQCTAPALASKPFTPLPVLGIPGWCAENENFSFYDDPVVFRPRRTTKHSSAESSPPARP